MEIPRRRRSTPAPAARARECARGTCPPAPARSARPGRSGGPLLSHPNGIDPRSAQCNRRVPMASRNIVVVGAGPVGTVAALACARLGHRVTLLEAEQRVNDAPRASTTQPPTLEIIEELGLIDEYIAKGLVSPTFQFWDRPTMRLIAEFDFGRLKDDTRYPYVVQTEQHKLALMGIERLRAMGATVRMGVKVTGLSQDAGSVTVETEQGPLRADYVIGCDGGRSAVRKSLGIEFEG